MDLILDGERRPSESRVTTVGMLVRHLSALPELKARVLDSIRLNGVDLTDWSEASHEELRPDDTVHVRTKPVSQLLLEAASTAREYLPRILAAAGLAARRLHEAREQEAFGILGGLVEGLQWYTQFLGYASSLDPVGHREASFRLSVLSGVLERLVSSWENQDLTLLADLLEYELAEELRAGMDYLGQALTWSRPGVES